MNLLNQSLMSQIAKITEIAEAITNRKLQSVPMYHQFITFNGFVLTKIV